MDDATPVDTDAGSVSVPGVSIVDADEDGSSVGASDEAPAPTSSPTVDADDAAANAPAAEAQEVVAPSTTVPDIPELARPVRIIVAGDSTAEALGAGVIDWAAGSPDVAQAELNIRKGCGFVRGGEYRIGDEWFAVRDACNRWLEQELPQRIAEATPDVVMMMTTSFDVLDHRYDGEGDGASPAELRDTIAADFAQVTDEALFNGATTVVWIKAPLPDPQWLDRGTDQEQPDRHTVLHEVMDELAAERPDRVHVIDLGEHFRSAGLDDDRDVRPDGVHIAPGPAADLAANFVGEQLVRAALDLL